MSDRGVAPIIIGITGKRDLGDMAEQVRVTLRACFDLLDERLGASRKILLSGLAEGTDSIAAQLALERPGWTVIGILPFTLGRYAEDFAGPAAETLRSLADPDAGQLSKSPRGRVRVLEPLLAEGSHHPLEDAALARHAKDSNPDRTDHYEQVGLFIAAQCTLLIAIMSSSEEPQRKNGIACDAGGTPLRVGGTARIVDFRLRGPDRVARGIIARSRELGKPSALDCPQTGPVWSVDLSRMNERRESPLDRVQLWKEGHAEPEAPHGLFAKIIATRRWFWRPDPAHPDAPTRIEKYSSARPVDLVEGLQLACRIDALNHMASEPSWQRRIAARLGNESGDDASAILRKARAALSIIQGSNKRNLIFAVTALAGFFLAAVVALELHVEFHAPIWPYLALFVVIVGIYALARLLMLQQYSEDYRAVAEALRVQLAWWDAGLAGPRHRVDQTYLRGATGTLGLVRAAVRHFVDAALLEKAPPRPRAGAPQRWITDQIHYFEQRIAARQLLISWFEELFWFLFVGSVGMAFSLFGGVAAIVGGFLSPLLLHWFPVTVLAIWLGLLMIARIFSQVTIRAADRILRRLFQLLNALMAFIGGLLLAVAIYQYFGPDVCSDTGHGAGSCASGTGHKLVLIMTVASAAAAGALRFFTERLASEAELHSYREILGAFTRARQSLNELAGEDAETARQREALLLELGEVALQENESWIRAHRVRPLEPMH